MIELLKQGGVILYPTDTVWGLGCDATNETAVNRIFQIKQRAEGKSLIVLATLTQIEKLCPDFTPEMRTALTQTGRPQTVILPNVTGLAAGVGAPDGSVAFRIPKNDFCLDLIQGLSRPIVSTSANVSGEPTPVTYDDISAKIRADVDGIAPRRHEHGATGRPSRIVLFDEKGFCTVLRD